MTATMRQATTATIRPITPDELVMWVGAVQTGFHDTKVTASEAAEFRRPFAEYDRMLGAFDGGKVAGTFRSFATQLTVPGGSTLPADAISAVTVLPTHRRRGILTAMMGSDLRSAAERGDAVAILIASEWPIYGRYGFGLATDHGTLTLDTRRVAFSRPTPGSIEMVDVARLRDLAPTIYERFRLAQPGSMEREPRWWDINLDILHPPGRPKWVGWQAICRDAAGAPTGYVRYRVEEKWDGHDFDSTLTVDELIATTPEAYARLWRFVCEVDLIARVRAENRPLDEPLRWLLVDGQAVRQSHRAHMLWVRILDPVAALSGRRYLMPGRVVLDVVDDAGFAGGRFAVEGGPDGATCVRTDESADVRLPSSTLGAVFLGGPNLRLLAAAGMVDEERPGGLDVADRMFRSSIEPWCVTEF